MTIFRYFALTNGSWFTAPFDTQEYSDAYVPPEGATEITTAPPSDGQQYNWTNGAWVVVPPLAPTIANVDAERDRRLGLGISYNFGDARGTQTIGTTATDMASWQQVALWAQTKQTLGETTATTLILTNSGSATIVPMDWFKIADAISAMQQPIWAHALALYQMNPIPANYAADSYWTS